MGMPVRRLLPGRKQIVDKAAGKNMVLMVITNCCA